MLPGSVRNWWAGLEAITLLFIKEHNFLCGELRKVGVCLHVCQCCALLVTDTPTPLPSVHHKCCLR